MELHELIEGKPDANAVANLMASQQMSKLSSRIQTKRSEIEKEKKI